jgi:hypothetical protein
VGELLATLPPGSMGLEYNTASVGHCRERGLDVVWYDGFGDGWSLSALPEERPFESMVISHVLEHLEDPVPILKALLRSAKRVGIRRVLVVVPGKAGYRSDPTHRTFIDAEMLGCAEVLADGAFRLVSRHYFPGNVRRLGDWFTHHELQVVYGSEL